MKTTWQIVRLSHRAGPVHAMWLSSFRVGQEKDGRICVSVDVDTFTDETFLVVAKWKKCDMKDLCA